MNERNKIMKVITTEIAKLSLMPGDILVMRINDKNYSYSQLQKIRKTLTDLRPPGVKAVLLDTSYSIGVISSESMNPEDVQFLLEHDLFHNERGEHELSDQVSHQVPDSNEH
jgi:hypothetical protein